MNPSQHCNRPKIVYLLDNFPVLSETFIQQEILILERQGLSLSLFAMAEPSARKATRGVWRGQTSVTYVSLQPWIHLMAMTIRRFLRNPMRFLWVTILTFFHYRLQSAIGYLVYGSYISEQIEHQRVTHLHAHFAAISASVAQVVSLLTGIPYSFTAHAYDIYLSRRSNLAYRLRMARFVVTCSVYNQHYLEKLVDRNTREHIHCIYLGLDLDSFPSPSPNRDGVSTSLSVPIILSVARLTEKKGLLYLLVACRILKDRGYDFTCRIVGDGPQRQVLEQKIHELSLSDNVELLGAVAHEQVIEMYSQATITSLPCIVATNGDQDGLPIALVEALYLGVPVVSTPVAGIPELISDEINGLLVPPQDSLALATALARLLDDPLLYSRLVCAGRKTVVERFDMAQNVQCLVDLICAD